MVVSSIDQLIGNTPVMEISGEVTGLKKIKLFAKLEYLNPFGSIKDRIALHMLNGIKSDLKNGQTVIESSSGNTAKALSLLCSSQKIPFKAITNRIKYDEVREILQAIGSQLEELPGYSDCADLFDPNDAIQYTKTLARTQPDKFTHTDQYFNTNNPLSHELTTAAEINIELGKIDYLFGFLGTCGSTFGTGTGLRKYNANCKVIGVTSKAGHSIPGGRNMGELHEVGFFTKDFYNDFLPGTVDESIDGMLKLAVDTGILGGPTSGMLFHKSCEYLRKIEKELEEEGQLEKLDDAKAVFFVCDRLEPYLGYLRKHRPSVFNANKNKDGMQLIAEVNELDVPSISADSELLQNLKPNTIIVDTRGAFAFAMGHIPNSINIQDGILEDMLRASKCFGKAHTVIIVCRLGDSSQRLAQILANKGIASYSVEGGYQAYKKTGLPVEKSLDEMPNHQMNNSLKTMSKPVYVS